MSFFEIIAHKARVRDEIARRRRIVLEICAVVPDGHRFCRSHFDAIDGLMRRFERLHAQGKEQVRAAAAEIEIRVSRRRTQRLSA